MPRHTTSHSNAYPGVRGSRTTLLLPMANVVDDRAPFAFAMPSAIVGLRVTEMPAMPERPVRAAFMRAARKACCGAANERIKSEARLRVCEDWRRPRIFWRGAKRAAVAARMHFSWCQPSACERWQESARRYPGVRQARPGA